jgi:mannosyltransferase
MQAGLDHLAINETAAATAEAAWAPRWQRATAETLPAMLPDLPALRSGLRVPSPWGVVLVLTLLAALLRLLDIGGEAFWKNELFSVYWVRNPFEFLLTKGLVTETNPPLYFVLLKAWTALFGSGEAGVRSLSALASTGCIPLAYLLGLELGGVAVGLVAATLLAISPVQIYFAHEARVYALLPLFVLIAMLGLCRFLRTPDVRGFVPDRRFVNSLDIYALGAIALLYCHATAALVLLALFVTTLLYFAEVRAPRSQVLAFVFANVIVGLLASPAIMALALQAKSPNLEWIPPMGAASLLGALRSLMVAPLVRFDVTGTARETLSWTELGLALATLIVLAAVARRGFRDRLCYALLALFPLLFVMLVCGISVFRPILIPRITVWLVVPVVLIAAFAFTAPGSRRLRPVAIALMACCIVLGLFDTTFAPARHNPDWRGFIADARAATAPDTMLVVGPHAGPLGILYYGDAAIAGRVRQWRPPPGHPETNAERLELTASGAGPISTVQLGDAIRSGRPVSLILDDDDAPLIQDLQADLPEFTAAARRDYPALAVFTWPPVGRTP